MEQLRLSLIGSAKDPAISEDFFNKRSNFYVETTCFNFQQNLRGIDVKVEELHCRVLAWR